MPGERIAAKMTASTICMVLVLLAAPTLAWANGVGGHMYPAHPVKPVRPAVTHAAGPRRVTGPPKPLVHVGQYSKASAKHVALRHRTAAGPHAAPTPGGKP